MCSCGSNSCTGCESFTVPEGPPGVDGWSPVFAVVSDGPTREVLRLVDWTGGTGSNPGHIGEYVSTTGFTAVIGAASNIRGTDGADGATGSYMFSYVLFDIASASNYISKGGGVAYVGVAKFIFPGITAVGSPTKVYANIWGPSIKNKNVRIYDATNAVVVAEKTSIAATSVTNISTLDGVALNFPINAAVFEIQVSSDAGEECRIAGITMY